jgi:hypothetical protein
MSLKFKHSVNSSLAVVQRRRTGCAIEDGRARSLPMSTGICYQSVCCIDGNGTSSFSTVLIRLRDTNEQIMPDRPLGPQS